MSTYLKSNNIKVFPSAYRGTTTVGSDQKLYDPESRLFTEKNLSNFGNNLADNNYGSYVLDRAINVANNILSSLTFVIHGYRFTITNVALTEDFVTATAVYAKIQLETKNTTTESTYDALSLANLVTSGDNILDVTVNTDSFFQGLSLETTGSSTPTDNIYYLQLLDYIDGA